jgi:hypothetical protein
MVMTSRIRFLIVAAGLCAAPALAPLDAQLIRVPAPGQAGRPVTLTVGAGFLQTQGRYDGQSGVIWRLGEAFQYRGSLDVGTRAGAIGVTGTLASVPIQRGSSASNGHIDLRQLMATFRSPERAGFYQLIEVSGGLAQWTNYSGTDVLSPEEAKARNAVALVIGYGFGFSMGNRMALTIVQDAATIIGSAEGLPSGERRSQQQFTTRVGLRYRLAGSR